MGDLLTLAQIAEARHTTPLVLLRFCHRHNVPIYRCGRGKWTFSPEALEDLDRVFAALAAEGAATAFRRNEETRTRREIAGAKTARTRALSEAQIVGAATRWKPYSSGIYFLIKSKRVVYVGQAANVIIRVSTHAFTKKFDAWHWIPCSREKLNMLERIYINAFLPPLNRDAATRRMRSSRDLEGVPVASESDDAD